MVLQLLKNFMVVVLAVKEGELIEGLLFNRAATA
jgi:hypothetical protein